MKSFVSMCALIVGAMVVLRPLDARADPVLAVDVEANAVSAVFRAMHDDLERCFARVRGNAYLIVEAVVDGRGHVRRVETAGDAHADPSTRRCVERRVARAVFPPPRGGGTSRIRTSLALAID